MQAEIIEVGVTTGQLSGPRKQRHSREVVRLIIPLQNGGIAVTLDNTAPEGINVSRYSRVKRGRKIVQRPIGGRRVGIVEIPEEALTHALEASKGDLEHRLALRAIVGTILAARKAA